MTSKVVVKYHNSKIETFKGMNKVKEDNGRLILYWGYRNRLLGFDFTYDSVLLINLENVRTFYYRKD